MRSNAQDTQQSRATHHSCTAARSNNNHAPPAPSTQDPKACCSKQDSIHDPPSAQLKEGREKYLLTSARSKAPVPREEHSRCFSRHRGGSGGLLSLPREKWGPPESREKDMPSLLYGQRY